MGRFPEDWVSFYSGEIVLALGYLHQHGVIYRWEVGRSDDAFPSIHFFFNTLRRGVSILTRIDLMFL